MNTGAQELNQILYKKVVKIQACVKFASQNHIGPLSTESIEFTKNISSQSQTRHSHRASNNTL